MMGYKLTPEQADTLRGKEFEPDNFFNPVQDINGDWFIFEVEYELASRTEYPWMDGLVKVEFIAPDAG